MWLHSYLRSDSHTGKEIFILQQSIHHVHMTIGVHIQAEGVTWICIRRIIRNTCVIYIMAESGIVIPKNITPGKCTSVRVISSTIRCSSSASLYKQIRY